MQLSYRLIAWTLLLTILLFLRSVRDDGGLLDDLQAREKRIFTTGEINHAFADDARRDRALAAAIAHLRDRQNAP